MICAAVAAAVRALPELTSSPAPWNLAKSAVSINQSLGGKIRFDGRTERTQADARLVTAAPTHHNLLHETLRTLCVVVDAGAARTADVDTTLAMVAQALAWVHAAPDNGAALYDALRLVCDDDGHPLALTGDQRAAWPEPLARGASNPRKAKKKATTPGQGRLFR